MQDQDGNNILVVDSVNNKVQGAAVESGGVAVLGDKTAAAEFIKRGTATTGNESSTGTPTVYYSTIAVTLTGFTNAPTVYVTGHGGVAVWAGAYNITSGGFTAYVASVLSGYGGTDVSWLAIGT